MKKYILRYLSALFLSIAPVCTLSAELLYSPTYGYSLDLPEEFILSQASQDGTGYMFDYAIIPVQVTVRIYQAETYDSAERTLAGTFKKLTAEGEILPVLWRNTDCVLSNFTMRPSPALFYEGWAVCAALPENKGYVVILAYADGNKIGERSQAQLYEQFILSVIDSLYIDRGSYYECGPVTAFAFPGGSPEAIHMTVAEKDIPAVIDTDDAAANQFVIDREFSVLRLYTDSEYRDKARIRYYRQIYRDAYKRLKKPAFQLYSALIDTARTQNPAQPQAALAQMLLSWVQTFPYERDFAGSDFSPLPAIIAGTAGSDCDSRALLLAVLLHQMNCNTVIFVSDVYRHAVFGIALDIPGAKIEVNGVQYVIGETTAPVSLGLIAQDMSQAENWLPVTFY